MDVADRIVVPTQPEGSMYKASEVEVEEYAELLGIDPELERDLFPIARSGLVASLPRHWVPCNVDATKFYFYFNKWTRARDHVYRQLVVEARERRQCYLVSLALLEDNLEGRIQGTNLAGDIVVSVSAALDESFGDVEDMLRSAIAIDDGRVLCFVLPDAKLIGFSLRSKLVRDIFEEK